MTNKATTAAPVIKAVGEVKNPPHGWGWLPVPEVKAEGEVRNPGDRDGLPADRS